MKHKPSLFEEVADRMEHELTGLADNDVRELPSISALASRFNVSVKTMWRAMQILGARGKITSTRGRRSYLKRSRGSAVADPASAAAARLAGSIRQQILDGILQVDAPMPKFQFFQADHRASSTTVVRSMGLLKAAGLIHKEGKRWIVGPALDDQKQRGTHGQSAVPRRPVVVNVSSRFSAWHHFRYRNMHIPRFILGFEHELANRSVDMMPVSASKVESDQLVTGGRKPVEDLIRRLEHRYVGAFFFGSPKWFSPSLDSWLSLVGRGGQPVVWFDYDSSGEGIDRRTVPGCRKFHRCYWNDQAAVTLAVKTLVSLGHRTIAMPTMRRVSGTWQARRLRLIRAAAAAAAPSAEVVTAVLDERFWSMADYWWERTSLSMLERLRRTGGNSPRADHTAKQPKAEELLHATPSMARLLCEKKATALIAVNDEVARELMVWLREAGYSVPGDVSVISFDNLEISRIFQVSSIDFGLESLAYQAAHLILGDIPVRPDDRWGNLGSRPFLVDRGSLAPPRRRT